MLTIARYNNSEESTHHGLHGLARSLQAGADIALLGLRVTKDSVLVVANDPQIVSAPVSIRIRQATLKELRRRTSGTKQPLVTLADALSKLFGSVMIALEIREHSAIEPLFEALKSYTKRTSGWNNFIICSPNPFILRKIRQRAPHAQIGLFHGRHTPLLFVAWQPSLRLSLIMVHRLSVNTMVVEAAHRLDLLVCSYMVDRPKTMTRLESMGVDAIITNHPEKFSR